MAAWASSGCSVLSLDVLQGGDGVEPGSGGSSSTAAIGSSSSTDGVTTSAAQTTTSITSTGQGGDGGAAASTGGGDGGDGGAASSSASTSGSGGGGGEACVDSCLDDTSTQCASFDEPDPFADWFVVRDHENGSSHDVVDDPVVSCRGAARITFTGPSGNPGGWYELARYVDGQTDEVTVDVDVWRATEDPDLAQGVLELRWERDEDDITCILQIYISDDPAAQAFMNEYPDVGKGTPITDAYVDLVDRATYDAWLPLGLDVTFGGEAAITVRSGDLEQSFPMDPDSLGNCDELPDPDSVRVAIGAPYNEEPVTLYYDDYRVLASP